MIVVSDTSVVLNLCCIERHTLLLKIFDQVLAPPEVREEFVRLAGREPRFSNLVFPEWIAVRQPTSGCPPETAPLDAGERAAIALALSVSADAILIDERTGQRIAAALGLQTIGVLGVLIQAKRMGHIRSVIPELQSLRVNAGFWMTPEVEARIRRLAGE